jgi:hypothetical protein
VRVAIAFAFTCTQHQLLYCGTAVLVPRCHKQVKDPACVLPEQGLSAAGGSRACIVSCNRHGLQLAVDVFVIGAAAAYRVDVQLHVAVLCNTPSKLSLTAHQ